MIIRNNINYILNIFKFTFSYKKISDKGNSNLLNTNIITDNELVFSEEYIENNKKIVISFVKELIIQYNIIL